MLKDIIAHEIAAAIWCSDSGLIVMYLPFLIFVHSAGGIITITITLVLVLSIMTQTQYNVLIFQVYLGNKGITVFCCDKHKLELDRVLFFKDYNVEESLMPCQLDRAQL